MPATEGSYEFRLFANSSFTRLATSSPIVLTDDPPVTGGSPPASGLYDLNGNRLAYDSSAYAISSTSNRLLSVSGAINRTYSYDNAGNPTSDGTATFTYNDAGRMVSATKASVTTTYALNALGQRVKKTNSGASTYFVYDEAGHLVGEYNTSGNLIQETVWFGDTPVATLRPNGGGVNLFYVHTDHLNTPRRVSRPSDNAVIWRWDSDPFGTTTANQDPDGDSNPFAYGLRFPGQYFDTETGLHYNYMRDGYEPAIGRYTQSDPIGLAGGMNSYTYVSGNPINLVDPLGLAECLYSISRHTLECKSSNPRPKGRRPSVSISGDGVFSGLGQCRNNPSNECQDSRDEGPVPEGPYRLNRHEGRAGFWRLESIPPVRGWQFALGLKRNGFMLHPGSISLGCITVDKNNEELMQGYALINSLLQSQDGRNTLEVIP
jgi:RHS repeat-associated protein